MNAADRKAFLFSFADNVKNSSGVGAWNCHLNASPSVRVMSAEKRTIRFEDLGEPVQKLLRSLRGSVSDEDLSLFEYVAVKDMAKIYQEMAEERVAAEIWAELKQALVSRREKAERKARELEDRERSLTDQQAAAEAEAARLAADEEARKAQEAEDAERRRRKEEKRRKKAEEAARNADAEAQAAFAEAERIAREEEEARLAEEAEAAAKAEAKRKRREEKARRLAEEAEALRQEREEAERGRRQKRNHQKEWEDYVASHPLEFTRDTSQAIAQVKVQRDTKPPPSATDKLLSRTYTPQCPNCHAKYAKPPPEWDCPMCLRKFRQRIKTWQPDEHSDNCMVCSTGVGRFTRHHCRNCGRVVCGKCSDHRAVIPALGFKDPVKVCAECSNVPVQTAAASAPAAAA